MLRQQALPTRRPTVIISTPQWMPELSTGPFSWPATQPDPSDFRPDPNHRSQENYRPNPTLNTFWCRLYTGHAIYFIARGACVQNIVMSIYVFVCPFTYLRYHAAELQKFFVRVDHWRRCDTLYFQFNGGQRLVFTQWAQRCMRRNFPKQHDSVKNGSHKNITEMKIMSSACSRQTKILPI